MTRTKKLTPRAKSQKAKEPLIITGRNASGKLIQAYIPAGEFPKQDPGLAIAKSLEKYPLIQPTPLPEMHPTESE